MRSLAFTATGEDIWNQFAALCCSCGLCMLYACPEELFPKEACDDAKTSMRGKGMKWSGPTPAKAHPMHDGRRVPIKSLIRKMDLTSYDLPAPWMRRTIRPSRLVLPLKQSAGSATRPLVRAGSTIGQVPPDALGAPLHAPLDGRVAEANEQHILIDIE
jgi:Na+-translocating ferredoxin:NAD+ oxidoreductase RnfC subunit